MPQAGEGVREKRARSLRMVPRGALTILIFFAILFVPAGRLDWWEGWIFFLAFLIGTSALVIWMRRKDPELLSERAQPGENVERWDRVIMSIYTILLIIMLIVAGIDSGRLELSSPPLFLRIVGWSGLAISMLIVAWTMSSNTFLSEMVRIQDDRGHVVITQGPYRYIRHPMYVGVILAIISTPLVLGSFWALIPAGIIVTLFIVRTHLEDITLQEKLSGYSDYAAQVRYRLIPGIW